MDQAITLQINNFVANSFYWTTLAQFFAVWVIFILIFFLIIVSFKRSWSDLMLSIIGIGAAWSLSQLVSFLALRPRPFVSLVNQIIPLVNVQADSSFPSDHTVAAFAIATILSRYLKNKLVIIILYLVALAVGLARIAVGVHYPTDIIAGALIGISVPLIAVWVFPNSD